MSTTTNLFYSTIFKTFDSDIDKASAKIGVFGKSFNEIFEARNKRRLDIDNLMFYEGKTLKEAKKDVDSFWSYLYQKKESFDWKKTASGAIVTADNIDDFIPKITPDKAEGMLQQIAAIDKAKGSWNDYFKELQNNNQGCIVDLIKNTDDLTKLTGNDLVQANQNARQAAIAHNAALKQQTLGAKAAEIGMKALSIAGNMLLSMGISLAINLVIKGIDYLIHRTEKMQEALRESVSEFNSVTDELKSLEEELKTTTQRIEELQKLADNGTISIAEEAELKTLKETNKELARKIALKQQDQADEARDVLKDSKKNANALVTSYYRGHSNASGERYDYENITPDEELTEAIKAYFKRNDV